MEDENAKTEVAPEVTLDTAQARIQAIYQSQIYLSGKNPSADEVVEFAKRLALYAETGE